MTVSCEPPCITKQAVALPPAAPVNSPAPVTFSPAPNTATGVDCNGNPVVITGLGVVQTVPNPNAVQLVKLCETKVEFDHTILCNPTGQQVLVVTNYSAVGIPTVTYYNMDGSAYTGSLVLKACNDVDTESDPVDMCDGGTTFIRWFVKKDGQPTGVTFDTTISGLLYTPLQAPSYGACFLDQCIFQPPIGVVDTWGQ